MENTSVTRFSCALEIKNIVFYSFSEEHAGTRAICWLVCRTKQINKMSPLLLGGMPLRVHFQSVFHFMYDNPWRALSCICSSIGCWNKTRTKIGLIFQLIGHAKPALLFFSRVHVRATLANTEARAELFTPRGSSSVTVHLPTVEITVRQQVSQCMINTSNSCYSYPIPEITVIAILKK